MRLRSIGLMVGVGAAGLILQSDVAVSQKPTHRDSIAPIALVMQAKAKISGSGAGFDLSARFGGNSIGIVLTRDGRMPAVERQLQRLGGQALFRDEKLGYLRVRIALTHWREFRTLPDIVAAQLDGVSQYRRLFDERWGEYPQFFAPGWRDPGERSGNVQFASVITREPDLPDDQERRKSTDPASPPRTRLPDAINPGAVIGAVKLRAANPTFDGRGTTIAMVERGGAALDVTHPALRLAKRLDGTELRKVARLLKADADMDGPEMTRDVKLSAAVNTNGTVTAVGDTLIRLPRPGAFRFGWLVGRPRTIINFRIVGPPVAAGVLLDAASGEVWIDSNQNHSFQDEPPLRDFNEERPPQSGDAIEVPSGSGQLVVVTRPPTPHVVRVHFLGKGDHATRGSAAAAQTLEQGTHEGIAPGARLVGISAGWSMAATLEGYILAARDRDVDVIVVTFGMDGGLDARDELCVMVLDRIAQLYQKVIVASAGNETGGPETGDQPASRSILTVGGYTSGAWIGLRTGRKPRWADGIWTISARGPTANGLLLPNVVAPDWAIAPSVSSTTTFRFPGGEQSPIGYAPAGGTSISGPIAGGAAAVLISAARQQNIPHDPKRIIWALTSGARWLGGHGPHEQGTGLIQLDEAWRLLEMGAMPPEIEVRGTSRHVLDSFRGTDSPIEGIWEREGWEPNQSGVRTLVLRRTTGREVPTALKVTWLGGSPVFETQSSVSLPLNVPIRLDVRVQASKPGVYVSLLRLTDPATDLVVRDIPIGIMVAPRDARAAQIRMQNQSAAFGERRDHAFFVPLGTQATRVAMGVQQGFPSLSLGPPIGMELSRPDDLMPVEVSSPRGVGSYLLSIPNPMPGTWGLDVATRTEQRNPSALRDADAVYSLGVDNLSVSATVCKPPPSASETAGVDVEFTNTMAPLASSTVRTIHGIAQRIESHYDADGLSAIIDVDVPHRSKLLTLDVAGSRPSDPVMLYLFDCTTGHCLIHEQLMPPLPALRTFVRAPRQGQWKVVVARGPSASKDGSFALTTFVADSDADWIASGTPSAPRKTGEVWRSRVPVTWTLADAVARDAAYLEVVDEVGERAERLSPFGALEPLRNFPPSLGPLVIFRNGTSTATGATASTQCSESY